MLPSPHPSPLVGRDRELAILREHLAAALAGQGSLVLIGGEAGIGKTALAEALCREAAEQGALVLIGRCYDLTETPPYGPWLELFGALPRDGDAPAAPAPSPRAAPSATVASQAALFRQVRDFFTALRARDPSSSCSTTSTGRTPPASTCCASSPAPSPRCPCSSSPPTAATNSTRRHPLARAASRCSCARRAPTRLDLRPLDAAAMRALVDGALRPRRGRRGAARRAICTSAAEGNALFLGELLRALEETGVLRRRASGWALGDLTRVPRAAAAAAGDRGAAGDAWTRRASDCSPSRR